MDRDRLTRLRWRLRGAWQWPVFVACTVLEAFLLNELPVWGTGPGGFVPGLLLATAFNLIVVAIAAPLAAMVLRRRRRDLPRAIATDYCGTALLGVVLTVLILGGIGNRGAIARDSEDRRATALALADYVHDRERAYLDGLGAMTIIQLQPGLYRGCVPGDEADEAMCVFVDTTRDPDDVSRDPEGTPNELYGR